MATQIQIQDIQGLRLRQQTLREVVDSKHKPAEGEEPRMIKVWKFDPLDLKQDMDVRTHEPTGVYSPHVAYGLRNLVVERQGKAEAVTFRNSNVRQVLRIRQEELDGNKKWKPSGSPIMVLPNTWSGVFVGNGNRAIIEELPT